MEERLEQSVIRVKRRRSLNLIHFPPSILPIAATYPVSYTHLSGVDVRKYRRQKVHNDKETG